MELILNLLIQNVYTILIVAIFLIAACFVSVKFLHLTPEEQLKKIKLILLDLTLKAESALGSNTGKAKRAQVYALFKEKCPIITAFMTEAFFDKILDETLEEMRNLLASNKDLKDVLSIVDKKEEA